MRTVCESVLCSIDTDHRDGQTETDDKAAQIHFALST